MSDKPNNAYNAEEGLRLQRAFVRIKNPDDRSKVIQLAEALANYADEDKASKPR